MNTLGKRLVFGLATILCVSSALGFLMAAVRYEPYGVPRGLRSEYKAKIAEVKHQAEIARAADSLIRPRLVVDEDHYEFGMLDPHSTNSHTFVVRNEGDAPLQLKVQKTSCKCTIGKLGSEIVAPGGETNVILTWNAGYKVDRYQQVATLRTNDPVRPKLELSVGGQIRAELVMPEAVELKTIDRGEFAKGSFVVYSQLSHDFYLDSATSDLPAFQSFVEPLSLDDPSLLDSEAKWAWKITVSSSGTGRGKFQGVVHLDFRSTETGKSIERTILASGKVRAPINFYGPDIHMSEGLDFGTLDSGKRHDFPIIVRSRSQSDRKIEVLQVKPKELAAELTPLKTEGNFRLVISVPENCPSVIFNADQKHGFVEVGDPNDDSFRNWIPVYGAVVNIK